MIVFKNLKVGHKAEEAIRVPDCSIEKNVPLCLLGPSGTGKSTLIHTMLGLLNPLNGEILGLPSKKSALFQEDRLIESMSGLDNVRLVLSTHTDRSEVLEHFKYMRLEDYACRPVSEYSGGMRRRICLIRAMMKEAEFVALDEAFQGLDKENRDRCINYILDYGKNKYLVLATHEIEDAVLLRAAVLYL